MIDTEKIMELALELAGLSAIPQDSGIWVPGKNIRKILFGIDAGSAELEIAKRLGYDLVIAHHPPEATLQANQVYRLHVEQMVAVGVPRAEAEQAIAEEIEGMQLRAHARIYDHTVSVARLIEMPFMNIHTPLDEIGRQRLVAKVDTVQKANPHATLGDLRDALDEFGEIRKSLQRPFVAVKDASAPAGNVVVSHGALEVPAYPIFAAYFSHGVNTVMCLRVSQSDLARLRRERLGALIVIGHIAGDSVGISPFISALESKGIQVTRFSGILTE